MAQADEREATLGSHLRESTWEPSLCWGPILHMRPRPTGQETRDEQRQKRAHDQKHVEYSAKRARSRRGGPLAGPISNHADSIDYSDDHPAGNAEEERATRGRQVITVATIVPTRVRRTSLEPENFSK